MKSNWVIKKIMNANYFESYLLNKFIQQNHKFFKKNFKL